MQPRDTTPCGASCHEHEFFDSPYTLHHLGGLLGTQGDYEADRSLLEESLAIFRELQSREGIAQSIANLAGVARHLDRFSEARRLYQEGLAILRELGKKRAVASSLQCLGYVLRQLGDDAGARLLRGEPGTLARAG